MMNLMLVACLLLTSFEVLAKCTPDAPEIGDIGPSSELVCRELERRFPNSVIAVENRTIHSPDTVAVQVSIDGESMNLDYALDGPVWELAIPQSGLTAVTR